MTSDDDVKKHLLNIEARLDRLSPSSQLPFDVFSKNPDDVIDLRQVWRAIWRGKWIVLGSIVTFSVASVFLALSLPNIYKAQALLAPSDDANGGGLSRMAGQLGGLASLAGINLGSAAGANKVSFAIEVLQSREFIGKFIEKHSILPALMAVKSWDANGNELIYDADLYDPKSHIWVRKVDPPRIPQPSFWEAFKVFRSILSVAQDSETGFVTVSIEHRSPHVAKDWVELLVRDVNSVMKARDVAEAQRSVDYLQKQLHGVSVADMRTVFYQLIEEQMKTIMLAEVRDEYVFSTIDAAVVAEEKIRPKRALICLLGVILGGAAGLLIILSKSLIVERYSEDEC